MSIRQRIRCLFGRHRLEFQIVGRREVSGRVVVEELAAECIACGQTVAKIAEPQELLCSPVEWEVLHEAEMLLGYGRTIL